MHEFFYEQSNYKVGASENNLEFDFVMNQKELFSNNYPKKIPEKYPSLSSKNLWLFEKLLKSKPQFNMAKKIIYSLSIFGILFIFGFLILFVLQSKKNESNIINKSFIYEKKF